MTEAQKKEIRSKMRAAHKLGQDVSLMATCPDSYQIALRVKYSKTGLAQTSKKESVG